MNNLRIFNQVMSVPEKMTSSFERGSKTLTTVKPIWRIEKLTELFGPCGIGWVINITSWKVQEFKNGAASIVVEIDLLYKETPESEWSQPVKGIGTSWAVFSNAKGEMVQDDEAWKKAYSDAIATACKSLGFAADLYAGSDDDKYAEKKATAEKKQEETKPANAPATKMTVTATKAEAKVETKAEAKTATTEKPKVNDGKKEELLPNTAIFAKWVTYIAQHPRLTNSEIRGQIEQKKFISDESFQTLMKCAGR